MPALLEAAPEGRPTVDVAAAVEARRLEAMVKAMVAYRSLVTACADGEELSGKRLDALADAADRLRLPQGALAADVQVVLNYRGNQTLLVQRRQDAEQLRQEAELASREIEGLERRLKEAKWTIQKHRNIESQPSGIMGALAEQEQENPRLFGAVAVAAAKLLEAAR
ncbi:MAG: hypothetical protein HQ464_04780 [Planctomycetes bacterium]|nr:hypothetical protein [Planctomycetota bacterium]